MCARRGLALFAAIAVMALIGLLVAGALASFTMAERSSRLAVTDAELMTSADYALGTMLADARRFGFADLALGAPVTFQIAPPGLSGVRVVVTATRLPGGVVWLVADATSNDVNQSKRRINFIIRFPSVGLLPGAAIIARGNVRLGSGVVFQPTQSDSARDAECIDAAPFDVIVAPGAAVSGGDSSRVVSRASSADSATYYLTASQRATLDSNSAVVHVRGDTTIAGGALNGILIADGSVTIAGAFTVTGMIVARGRIVAVAGGLSLTGNMLSYANPTNGDPAIELSTASIRHAPCVTARALRNAVQPRPARQRSWVELF
jgi:hypothetical protein